MKKTLTILALIATIFTSCKSAKDVAYMQQIEELPKETLQQAPKVPDQIVMPGDLIDITIMATDRTSVQPFNRRVVDILATGTSLSAEELNYYLVDNNGYIDMPVIGRIKVQGMTKSELEEYVRQQIYPKYIHEVPSVTVRFENFRVSVLGDVQKPGSYTIPNERVNILEALAMAGDLNITGRRDNVLLVRVNADGSRNAVRINLNDKLVVLSTPVKVTANGKVLFNGMVKANLRDMVNSCATFFDPERVFPASILIDLSADATGVEQVVAEVGEEKFYDLNGRPAADPQKGVYVNNFGKKVLF